jgi:hypothetical protein
LQKDRGVIIRKIAGWQKLPLRQVIDEKDKKKWKREKKRK